MGDAHALCISAEGGPHGLITGLLMIIKLEMYSNYIIIILSVWINCVRENEINTYWRKGKREALRIPGRCGRLTAPTTNIAKNKRET